MLSQIKKRSIHEEAKHPTFNVINHIKARRFEYLGHILRLDNDRTLKSLLIQSNARYSPFSGRFASSRDPFSDQRPISNSSTRSEELEKIESRNVWGVAHFFGVCRVKERRILGFSDLGLNRHSKVMLINF